MKKLTEKELNDWYGKQPFDNVEKITNVDIWSAKEVCDMSDEELNDETILSRDEKLDEARTIWNSMTLQEKISVREEIGDEWA